MGHVVRILIVLLLCARSTLAQSAPASPDHPWHSPDERNIEADAKTYHDVSFVIDPSKTYSLAELIDQAQSRNPDTRLAWERARAQAANLGIARSELYPTLAAAALSETQRMEVLLGSRFVRQTVQDFEISLALNSTQFSISAPGRAGSMLPKPRLSLPTSPSTTLIAT